MEISLADRVRRPSPPTSLQIALYAPSARAADNTSLLTSTTGVVTDPNGAWTVNLGTNSRSGASVPNANPQVYGADPASTFATSHGFQWFTLAQATNTSNQTEYLRISITSVQNSDNTWGQGGRNFALALCKTDASAAYTGDWSQNGAFAAAGVSGDPSGTNPAGHNVLRYGLRGSELPIQW